MYAMEYYSAIVKNEIMPFSALCMDLKMIIVSEGSQAEEDKYCSWHFYAESRSSDTNEAIYKREIVTDTENKVVVIKGERVAYKLGDGD